MTTTKHQTNTSESERILRYVADIAVLAARAQKPMDAAELDAYLTCIECTCLYVLKEHEWS